MTEAETTPGMFPDKPGECPEATWEHLAVWERIKEALYSLPSSFKMEGHFPAIPASDLHSANTLLGAAIEEHIPTALNQMRATWDPSGDYGKCIFKRQPQTFPDVLFRKELIGGSETLFGIEIKSWYILAKEKEPSFRFYVNQKFCHPADLCVVYPWAFSAGVSGTPKLFRPLVVGARKAARIRNECWISRAKTEEEKAIKEPEGDGRFHTTKSDRINDSSDYDDGGNFGRLARTNIWAAEIKQIMREEHIAGIPLLGWHAFLSAFKETATLEESVEAIRRYLLRSGTKTPSPTDEAFSRIAEGVSTLYDLMGISTPAKPASKPKKKA